MSTPPTHDRASERAATPADEAVDGAHDAVATGDAAPGALDEAADAPRPREIGGQAGPEPTRYGDWEKKGRCTDF